MNTQSRFAVVLAAAALFAAPAFAADGVQATAPVASAAGAIVAAQAINTVTIPASRTRAEVHAEAVDFVAHYKTALEVQLELAKN